MNLDLARSTLKDILALDPPIGRIMEVVRVMQDGAEKATMKESCGTLLSLQLDVIQRITKAYPELREEVDPRTSDK